MDNEDQGFNYNVRPEDICPAGGIHDLESQWQCSDYVLACYCCPCYLMKECCCGWFFRNPTDDGFDGVGCRPTGPKVCTKCKQTEKGTKETYVMQHFQEHTGAGPPQVPSPIQYASTQQMSATLSPSNLPHPPPPYPPQSPPPPYERSGNENGRGNDNRGRNRGEDDRDRSQNRNDNRSQNRSSRHDQNRNHGDEHQSRSNDNQRQTQRADDFNPGWRQHAENPNASQGRYDIQSSGGIVGN